MSFGDPYDSPSSPSPSLPYVAESPMESSPRVFTPSIASPPPSRPSSAASSRFPPHASSGYPPKSPRTHWAQLRRAVLPEEPPLPEEIAPGQELPRLPSPPPRSTTPTPSIYALTQQIQQKSSRLARFGFRHHPSEGSSIMVPDPDNLRRLEIDVRRACRMAKLNAAGIDDGAHQSTAPSMFAPPAAPFAAGHSASPSVSSGLSSKFGRGLRRPPSIQSIATQPGSKGLVASGPYQILSILRQYAETPGTSSVLPAESEVLSVLLSPFLDHFASGRRAEDARTMALEAFEVIIQVWRCETVEGDVERCLWCIQAATLCEGLSRLRPRIISTLKSIVIHPDTLRPTLSPLALQTMLQHLLLLQRSVSSPHAGGNELAIDELIHWVIKCEYARIDESALSAEYGVNMQTTDNPASVAEAVFSDGVSRLMRSGSIEVRRWVLHNGVEKYWHTATEDAATSALLLRISARQLKTFADSVTSLLDAEGASGNGQFDPRDAAKTAHLLRTRILVAKHLFRDTSNRQAIIKIVTRLFLVPTTNEYASALLDSWRLDDAWTADLRHELNDIINMDSPIEMTRIISAIYGGCSRESRISIANHVIPALFERIVRDPMPPSTDFRGLLDGLALNHPQIFYKPLFTCAKSLKDHVVVDQLQILVALSHHVPDLLTRDADMTAIALMSDGGGVPGKGKAREDTLGQWSAARPGQSAIVFEIIFRLEKLKRDHNSASAKIASVDAQFFHDLDNKLAVLIAAKERSSFIPFSQRVLLGELLYRIRLYTESWHTALWLPSLALWTSQSYLGASVVNADDPFADTSAQPQIVVSEDVLEEPQHALDKLGMIYSVCATSASRDSKHRSHIPAPKASAVANAPDWASRFKLRHELPRSVPEACLRLLVAVSAQMTEDQCHLLAPALWSVHLEHTHRQVAAPASFLIMQCAERIPMKMKQIIEADLLSPFTGARHGALTRLAILFSWRFDVSMQKFLSDRQYKRPFRNAGKPLSFVPTEVGLQRHTGNDDEDSSLLSLGAALPADIRRGLLELDWYRSETEKENDKKVKWEGLPLSSLPMTAINLIEYERALEVGRGGGGNSKTSSLSPTAGILSRKTSTGGTGAPRRRSVFVQLIASIFASLSKLATDPDDFIALSARDLLFMAARDDPGLVCRPLFDELEDPVKNASSPALQLHAIVNLQSILPPTLSHYVFNHVAGYVKTVSRDVAASHRALESFASVMVNISELASHVSDLSVRDLRRNKLEVFFLPTFDLWFPSALSAGHLPSGPSNGDESHSNRDLAAILTIRTSQNVFLYNLIRRFPKEAVAVRKGMSALQLPEAMSLPRPLDFSQFIPRPVVHNTSDEITLRSQALAKSYLILVTQLFRTYSPTTSDRAELANLIDGISLTMLIHGSELSVLSMALTAYTTACTRFRRLFVSNSGYTSIVPPLLHIYSTAYDNEDVRAAIEYTAHRFFALHDKAFVFQALDAASQMMGNLSSVTASEDRDRFTKRAYLLFASLHMPYRPDARDTAGLTAAAQYQEKEALLTMLAEPLEAVLAVGARARSQPESHQPGPTITGPLEKWYSQCFRLDDLVRLFLTIIAHAPGSKRAEYFLRLLGTWTPYLYHGSKPCRQVLQSGIEALANVILSKSGQAPRSASTTASTTSTSNLDSLPGMVDNIMGNEGLSSSSTNDGLTMCYEYIRLVVQFNRSGGQLTYSALHRTFDAIKILVRDHGARFSDVASGFVHESTRRFLEQEGRPTTRQVIAFLADVGQLFRAHGDILNITPVVETVTRLLVDPVLSTDREFIQTVVDQFCRPAIEACSAAASSQGLARWPARESVPSLFAVALSMTDGNATQLVVQQPVSASYLAHFILPLCYRLGTAGSASAEAKQAVATPADCSAVWRRLLGFVMEACSVSSRRELQRTASPSGEKTSSKKGIPARERLAIVAVGLQVVKVIILRGEKELESSIPGVWPRIGRFLREILADGELGFAVPGSGSPNASPLQSRASSPAPAFQNRQSLSSDHHISSIRRRIRAVDYLLASMIHFAIIYRSPLIVQLRLWFQEHIMKLTPTSALLQRSLMSLSPSPSLAPSPSKSIHGRESRRVSSMFSKLRPKSSTNSPEASPFLEPQTYRPPSRIEPLDIGPRRPGFQHSRPSSLDLTGGLRPIVHLGPVVIQEPPLSPFDASEDGGDFARGNGRINFVSNTELVNLAIQDVQVAQAWFGCGDDNVVVDAWSRLDGLRAVHEEMRWIVLEFHDSFYSATSLSDPYVEVRTSMSHE